MNGEDHRVARAGDYVLGLMDEDERERAERDLERDPAFREAVMFLAQKLHALDRTAGVDPVPESLWRDIEQRIADLPQMRGVVAPVPPLPVTPTTRRATRRLSPASLGGWRGGLLAASLLAAAGIGFASGRGTVALPDPVVVVILDTAQDEPGAIFEAYADDSVRIIPLQDFAVPPGKILEVWTLYDQQVGPVSLGTLPRTAEARLSGPNLPMPQPEQLYEITLEDAPRSPTGRPTGPILVKGLAQLPVR